MLQNSRSQLYINCLFSKHFRVITGVEVCKILQCDFHSVIYWCIQNWAIRKLTPTKQTHFFFSP